MLSLVVAVLAGQLAPPMHFLQPNLSRPSVVSGPAFEFAPLSGAGIGTACACAAVTGSKGKAVTWTRGSTAECTTLGLATSGLTTTSMFQCASNLPRVESDGTALGVLVERTGTNNLPRSEALDNVAWTATATVTADQATSPKNTATGDQLSDGSALALQGVSQAFVTSSLTRQSVSCYVRAGTLTSATIAMAGTGNAAGDCTNTVTGLSGTTWNRLSCSSSAAYAAGLTAVTLTLSVGTVVGDTGTIMAWGCQHELNGYVTSYIPTVAAAATRSGESNSINGQTAGLPGGSMSVTAYVTPEFVQALIPALTGIVEGQIGSASGAGLYFGSGVGLRCQTLNAGAQTLDGTPAPAIAIGVTRKWGCLNVGGNSTVYEDSAILAGPTAKNSIAAPWSTTTGIGYAPGSGATSALDGIISRVCIDATAGKCPQ